ncbi:MAG TPA: hypothetical protein PLU87_18405 [Sedimentisphaerales bacterium]|nr:hypothetical protein [Sedimentisphaerales bacterium]HRS13011.1 hypothetical protein [Sedimentisphaerales bacterium]HRV49642.1 hypothetical protein [Sedimentisphaerales bacterium]
MHGSVALGEQALPKIYKVFVQRLARSGARRIEQADFHEAFHQPGRYSFQPPRQLGIGLLPHRPAVYQLLDLHAERTGAALVGKSRKPPENLQVVAHLDPPFLDLALASRLLVLVRWLKQPHVDLLPSW